LADKLKQVNLRDTFLLETKVGVEMKIEGEQRETCPYYASRSAVPYADLGKSDQFAVRD
jgi:hypothetical protein